MANERNWEQAQSWDVEKTGESKLRVDATYLPGESKQCVACPHRLTGCNHNNVFVSRSACTTVITVCNVSISYIVLDIVKIGDLTLLTPLNPGAYLSAASNPCGKYISTASVIFGCLARAPRWTSQFRRHMSFCKYYSFHIVMPLGLQAVLAYMM